MAVGYMNTWNRLRVSADSSWSLFSCYRLADLRIESACAMHLVVWVLYFLRLLRGAFSPNNEPKLSCSDNFTDKIWPISMNIGAYLCEWIVGGF